MPALVTNNRNVAVALHEGQLRSDPSEPASHITQVSTLREQPALSYVTCGVETARCSSRRIALVEAHTEVQNSRSHAAILSAPLAVCRRHVHHLLAY
jgi:hypothetical protein